jgi:hypothetical protein
MRPDLVFRLRASGLHLLGSVVVLGAFLWLVYGYWYMNPFQVIYSTVDVVKILVLVDLILGPLLSLIVFNIAKPRAELVRDLAIILVFQISALAWGAYVTYSVRPQFVVFAGSHIHIVSSREIYMNELPADIRPRSWYEPPVAVSIKRPQSEEERKQLVLDLLDGKVPELIYQAQRYRPYAEYRDEIAASILPWEELVKRGGNIKIWLDTILARGYGVEYIVCEIDAKSFSSLALVRISDGRVIEVMQPAPLPENKS